MLSKSEAKYIQSLSQKKVRALAQCFIIEGPKIVEEAISICPAKIKEVFALESWATAHKQGLRNIKLTIIDDKELSRISQLTTPNQVLALVEMPPATDFHFNAEKLSLALDGIQDPGNMGTILRIADWFGISQVICSPDCADVYSPKVVQATMGSIFRIQTCYVDLADWLKNKQGLPRYGAALQGEDLAFFKGTTKGILVIGNESKGISDGVRGTLSRLVTIPRYGNAESLNAAVATGIILSHFKN
ncbi:MAG: RNA methyltransferase [Niabella sp.]